MCLTSKFKWDSYTNTIKKLITKSNEFSHLMRHGGFEPPTTWLKVKCSTNWASIPSSPKRRKCPEPESNQWHADFQSAALPTELSGQKIFTILVAGTGFEPMTFGLWARRASRLLHPAILCCIWYVFLFKNIPEKENGWRWIRTTEANCSRFTVCPLWPLGNPSIWNCIP